MTETHTGKQSRNGKKPVEVVQGVQVTISGKEVTAKGPKGELKHIVPSEVVVEQQEGKITVIPAVGAGKLGLQYATGFELDSVSFGQQGPAPDPLRDETIAKYWNGLNYSDEWVRDPTPTLGARNDRPGRLDPPPVVLNEIEIEAMRNIVF